MTLISLTTLPDEVFFQAIVKDLNSYYLPEKIKTCCRLNSVSKTLSEKVKYVFNQIIKKFDIINYLFSPSAKTLENVQKFLKSNYDTLKRFRFLDINKTKNLDLQKWKKGDALIHESILHGLTEQAILYNQGNPELWIVELSRKKLSCVQLIDGTQSTLSLEEELSPVSSECNPCMALSDSWIAVCCNLIEEKSTEIAIINKNTGELLHKILDTGQFLKIECENNYLYILCVNDGKYTLLQYDSSNWEALPKKLALPEKEFYSFYIDKKYLVFTAVNHIFAISKKCFFSNKKYNFISLYLNSKNPKIQISKDTFYTLIQNFDSSIVSRFWIENNVINLEHIQTLSLDLPRIINFNIQFDKIFISDLGSCVLYYDLVSGRLIKKFFSKVPSINGTNFFPTFIASGPEKIQYLFNSFNWLSPYPFPPTSLLTFKFNQL